MTNSALAVAPPRTKADGFLDALWAAAATGSAIVLSRVGSTSQRG